MKKIKIYYSCVMWPTHLIALAGCNHYAKNYTIYETYPEQKATVYEPFNSRRYKFDNEQALDNLLEKSNILFEKFKQCTQYIDRHRTEYLVQASNGNALKYFFYQLSMQRYQELHDRLGTYLEGKLLPNWGMAVKQHIRHTLDISLLQSNNSSEKVYKTYINARNAIDSVYSTNNPYHDRLKQLLEPTTNQGIAMMQEVEACRLGAIKKMYAYLNRLIRYITWNNNAPTLGKQAASNDELSLSKQAALGSLTMFYSITYSFAIIDLVSFLDLEATRLLQPYLLPSRVDINIHWLAATNLYLTDYIETNDTNRNQINSRVQDFIKHVSRLVKQAKNNNNNDDICQLVKKAWVLKAPFFIEEEARLIVE